MLDILKTQIRDFHARRLPTELVERDLAVPMNSGKAVAVIGPRRAGKTWFLLSLVRQLEKTVGRERLLYLNFEDERLQLDTGDLQTVLDAYAQLYPETPLAEAYFFLDEVQVVPGWEKFVRRLTETVSRHVFVTGSSATLLGSEIASALRGHALTYRLLPFSFREFLRYRHVDGNDVHATANRNRIAVLFDGFVEQGGYPEVLGFEPELRARTHQSYVDIMVYRDIIERHEVTHPFIVKDMARRFVAQSGRLFSVHKYYRDLQSRGIKIGKDTLYAYADHFVDAFFVLPLHKHDESVPKSEQALKRFYVNDTGLVGSLRTVLPEDRGFMLETAVFLEMAKREDVCHYWANNGECDFVVSSRGRVETAIQVCEWLTPDNRNREIGGVSKALKRFGLETGLVLTRSQSEDVAVSGGTVRVMPVWKWLCAPT